MNLIPKLKILMKKKDLQNISQLSKSTSIPYTTLKSIFDGDVSDLRLSTARKLCDFFEITLDELLDNNIELAEFHTAQNEETSVFPVYKALKNLSDLSNEQNIIGYVSIGRNLPKADEYFALKVNDDSMKPVVYKNDIVIVHIQSDVADGETGVVIIDDKEAIIKKIMKKSNGTVELVSFNQFYPAIEVKDNYEIIGKVIEARITKIFE